jgi:4'-phosphopantetheinyl transferase
MATGAEVGVDVEYVRARSDYGDIAQHFFSIAEIHHLTGLPRHLYDEAFFSCWTKKEAYVKARGEGLSIPLNSFSVHPTSDPAPGPVDLCVSSHDLVPGRRWSLYTLRTVPGYAAALAIEGSGWRLSQWQWTMPGRGVGRTHDHPTGNGLAQPSSR